MQGIFLICGSGKLKLERYTKLKNICSLLNIINVTELRWMNCLEHVACILGDEMIGTCRSKWCAPWGMKFYFRSLKIYNLL
jgi:hypothetical protein